MFTDRHDAGRRLADPVARLEPRPDVVLALPRGGIPIGYEIAQRLGVPLDVVVVRKLGAPGREELAMGAIASGEVQIVDPEMLEHLEVTPEELDYVIGRERIELARREELFRGDGAPFDVIGANVLIVDDGLATGATMLAAIEAVRARRPARITIAVPIAAPTVCAQIRELVDHLVCLVTPHRLRTVGEWYEKFPQIEDDEARALLGTNPTRSITEVIPIPVDHVELAADLVVPARPHGVIVFVHGSGSGRHSPRNRRVADALARAGFATVLFDLLTPDEEIEDRKTAALRFDLPLLEGRLVAALAWTARHPTLHGLPVGLFGSSTGAAAALIAATKSRVVATVVCRGGRPDLANDALPRVTVPCLFLIGGDDRDVIALNHRALAQLGSRATSTIHVIPEAGHLFEEPGALDEVIALSATWFARQLGGVELAAQLATDIRVP